MTLVRGTRKDRIEKFVSAQRLRLRDDSKWELLPAGISFTIAMLFIGHLLPGLNPRLGNRANIMELEAKNEPDGSIWLGVFIKDGSFYIQTSDRKLLRFNADDLDKPTLPSLISYLRHRREKEVALLSFVRIVRHMESEASKVISDISSKQRQPS